MSFRMLPSNPLNRVHFPSNFFQLALVFYNALSQTSCSVPQDVVQAFSLSFVRACHFANQVLHDFHVGKEESRLRMQRARVREGRLFHGLFYGLQNFRCKTAPFSATLCEPACLWSALKNTLRNTVKTCATR
jgi:hypothetical protein